MSQAIVKQEVGFGSTDLLLIFMTVVWGSNFSVIKHTFEDLPPLAFNGLRFAIASLAIAGVMFALNRDLKVKRGDLRKMFVLALFGNSLYQAFFIIGVARTRAGSAALIVSTTPLLTAVIGRLMGQERFTGQGLLGLLLAVAGVALIILGGSGGYSPSESLLGDTLLMISSVCWAIFTVASKPMLHRYGAMKTTTLMMLLGTPALLVVCAPSLLRQDWSRVRPLAWGGLFYSALFAIVLAYMIWNYGVKRIGSTKTAIYSNLTPVVAMVVAWPALGEVPTLAQIAGAATIFISIYLVKQGTVAAAQESEQSEPDEASISPA